MISKLFIPVSLVLFLAGCSAIQKGYLSAGVESIRDTNDTLAQGLIASMCGISVGAYYRLQSPLHKDGIKRLCGGNNAIELGD